MRNGDLPEERFATDGFVRIEHFCSPEQVAEVLAELDRYITEVVPRIPDTDASTRTGAGRRRSSSSSALADHDGYFHDLLHRGALPQMAALLLGEDVRPINQQSSSSRPAASARRRPPHQDGFYFHLEPCSALTLWLALDDVDEENGCLRSCAARTCAAYASTGRTHTLGFSQGVPDFGSGSDCPTRWPAPPRPVT